MSIFKFRVIIDIEEDVFRDVEIETEDNFLSFHEAILQAFDFEEGEMASFYMSDENWEKGEEITLMEMSMGDSPSLIKNMKDVSLASMVTEPSDKIIYVYDFLRMWCFYIELVEVKKVVPSTIYPKVSLVYGDAPDQLSKEVDLFGGMDIPMDDEKPERTGDPELDAYLDDMDDEEGNDNFTSLDDIDQDLY